MSTTLRVEVQPVTTTTISTTAGMTVVVAIEVRFTNAADGTPVTELDQDVTIELSYAGLGLSEDQLNRLVIYNATRGEYLQTAVDRSRQVAVAKTRRLSTFALAVVQAPVPRLFLPVVLDQLAGGW